ncbi:conserved Plasmodium protein, unknown function [Plasmodium sp. gorilla clade G3]|nr:conserved Plasmodium protein, unknown function [Plasmodium sp. gorilla clade G3]
MDKDIFTINKIIEFQDHQKKIFQIWKAYVKEELLLMHSEENIPNKNKACNNNQNNICDNNQNNSCDNNQNNSCDNNQNNSCDNNQNNSCDNNQNNSCDNNQNNSCDNNQNNSCDNNQNNSCDNNQNNSCDNNQNNTYNNNQKNIYNIYNIYYKNIAKYNHIKSIRCFHKYVDEWKELQISLDCTEHIYNNYKLIKNDRHKKNIKNLCDKEKKSDSQSESEKLKGNDNKEIIYNQYNTKKLSKIINNDQGTKSNKLIDDIKINNKVLSNENYLNIYEKYIESLNKNIEKNLKEYETCIVTYNNFINRDINIIYNENITFLTYFYSCINIIKENKIIIPKGFYLYELIYPQTIHSFPVINKFNYYFVKLFINNKWYLIFVNLYLPYNKKYDQILSCYSTFSQEIWTHILIKALYKCFHIFHFKNYHLHIIEMLTGLNFIKSSFNINKIINNYKNNYIQCVLLYEHEKRESTNNTLMENDNKNIRNFNMDITGMNYNTYCHNKNNENNNNNNNNNNSNSNNNKYVHEITDNKQNIYDQANTSISIRNNNCFYYLICSYKDKQFIRVKCCDIKPYNYIQMCNHTINQKKNKENLLKGYKYINTKGNIQISNAELVPLFKNTPDIDSSEKYIKSPTISTNDHDIKNIYNDNKQTNKKYNVVINENTQNVIQSIKDIISIEPNNVQKIKSNDESDKSSSKNIHLKKDNKKNNKDICKWFKDNEIEKILELINVNYSSEYLIKIDESLKNNKIISYLSKNKFELISLNEYIKNKLKPFKALHKSNNVKNHIPKSVQHIHMEKKKGKNNQDKNVYDNSKNNAILCNHNISVLSNDCPYLILICYISIKEQPTENNKKETNLIIQNDNIITSEKDNVNINNFFDFFIYFFPHQMCKYKYIKKYKFGQEEKNSEQVRNKKKKKKKEKKLTTSQLLLQTDKKKDQKILFLNDMYECNLYFKKIGERYHNEDMIPFIPCNNFLQQILNNNDYKNYFFFNKIVKRKIRLEKNKEHFFILYTKRFDYNDFYIEWINENKNHERSYIISSSFITIEEYLEKYMKMSMTFLPKKEISLKNEILNNKVLLKFVININMNDKEEGNDEHVHDININTNDTNIERIKQDLLQQPHSCKELNNFHFYLIVKINDFNIVPYLNLYMCRINNDDMLHIPNNIEEQKKIKTKKIKKNSSKKNDSIYNCDEYINIVGTFHKYTLDELIFKIYIPNDQINNHHNYLFLLLTKKILWRYNVNFNIYINVAYPKDDNIIYSNHYENSKNNKKKIVLDIIELPSCCSNYTYTFPAEPKEICKNIMNTEERNTENPVNNNILHVDNKSIENVLNMGTISSYNDKNKKVHYNLSGKNIIQIVKKLIVKNKNEYTYGSIFIELKNYHLYEYIETKIIKVEKAINRKMTEDNFNVDFILTNYKRKVIFTKKTKNKKDIFFKHVLLKTNDTYFILIKVKIKNHLNSPELDLKILDKYKYKYISTCDKKDIPLNKSLLQKDKKKKQNEKIYKNEQINSNNIIITINILLNFIEYIHLIDDTTYEDIDREVNKYKEIKNIDIEQLNISFTQNVLRNIFDFKNEILLYFKRDYENIFKNILINIICDLNDNKEKHEMGNIKMVNDKENDVGNDKICINQMNNKDKNIQIDHMNRQLKKNDSNDINDNKRTFEGMNNFYLNKNLFYDFTSNILKYDEESLRYIFYKFFENDVEQINTNQFIEICKNIENLENIKNCSFLIKIEEKMEKNHIFLSLDKNNFDNNNNYDIKKKIMYNENYIIINQNRDILFDSIFTYGKKTQNIINDIINFYKIKNKDINLLKFKIDAELQLNEKCIWNFPTFFFNNNNNIQNFIKKEIIKQIKYIIYNNYKEKEKQIEKKKKILYNHSNYIKKRYNQSYKKIIIDQSINNINDLINITHNIENNFDLYYLKEINKNITKNIKERKIFVSNFIYNIKQKKLKKFNDKEFNNLYNKALQLNLHIYNKEYIKIIKYYIHIFNLLNQIKQLIKNVEWKKKKYTNNFQDIQINDIITDHNIFIHLYNKCTYLITKIYDIQLNDNYQNIYKDSTQLYYIIRNHQLQKKKNIINKNIS